MKLLFQNFVLIKCRTDHTQGFFLHPKLHVTIDFAEVFLIAKMDSVLHDQRLRQWVRQTLSDSKKPFDPRVASSSKITMLVVLSPPQQPFVFVMRANPEPVHRVALQQPE